MSLDTAPIRRFDGFELDVIAHELSRQGARIRLQEQPVQILSLLLERAGEVVTREELRRKVWPSSVFVDFDHGLNNAIARLRDSLGDDRETPRYIETLPRIGYRFICPVEPACPEPPDVSGPIEASEAKASDAPTPAKTGVGPDSNRRPLIVGVLLTLGAFGLLLIAWPQYWRTTAVTGAADLPRDPSLAVLPFVNLTADDNDEHFADGLTEALVTKLAGMRDLKVVARTSSFHFKGKQDPAPSIAQSLHVNHLLEGSVARAGTQLRITAQLIDARNDKHVWSQTFDRRAGDIFQIEDEIAFAVAAALKVSLLDADEFRMRSHGTSDPEAYRLYLIARSHLLGRTRTADPALAKRALDAALARDPKFVAAHAAQSAYYFQRAWTKLTDTEEGARLGIAAAQRAVELDPNSSEALEARANFGFWRYRFEGDYAAYVAAQSDMQRAINIDPSNAGAFEDYGRGVLWNDPDLASSLTEQSIQLDLLCTGANIMIAVVLGTRGHLDTARQRCEAVLKRLPEAAPCRMAIATLDVYFGNFEPTIALMRASEKSIGGATRLQLWAVYMSLGDRAAAEDWLNFGPNAFEKALSDAARFAMDARYEQAFQVLEQHRSEYPLSHLLDFPTARFALIAAHPAKAREILEQRLPDVVSGIEPISARNVLPALDLAAAQFGTGAGDDSRQLLGRIAEYLDGPTVLQLPLFTYERARAYALAGEPDAALRTLDRAYELGLRTTWALDLRPQSFLYVDPLDADPAFTALRRDLRFVSWRDRIRADNARQLAHLRATEVAMAEVTRTD
jgi:TolB-like protein/DNA-binding winged helix-turn-helix (wHTH) protein/Tfp pilus assembly protein PilF